MTFDPDKIFNLLLLRSRPKSEEAKRYGTFNRRMIAGSLDSMLVTVLVAPLVDYIFIQTYGAVDVNIQGIATRAAQESTSSAALQIFFQEMQDTGFLDRWVTNMKWQTYALCLYVTLCWHFWSATPGKMLCRLKIVDAKTGAPMGDWQSILRVLGYFISAIPLGLGFLWIGMNRKRRGWHDYLAGTVVVVRQRPAAATSTPESAHPLDSQAPSAAE